MLTYCGKGYQDVIVSEMDYYYFLTPKGGEGKTKTLGCGFIGSNFRLAKPGWSDGINVDLNPK